MSKNFQRLSNALRTLLAFGKFRKISSSGRMDITANMMDSIAGSHEILQDIIYTKGANQKDEAIREYLDRVKFPPVEDFKKGLEWFNVSEALTFSKHLKGKVVVLDFFTYCCINCMHILPELREIESEFPIEDGLVVIGVHSAKFDNEKDSKNILAAVQRYNIAHPVVNDAQMSMWKSCDVHCWPTLVLLGPHGNPLVMLTGEGHKDELRLYIKNALKYYGSKNEISAHKLPLKSAYHLLPDLKGPFLFPGKITAHLDTHKNAELIAIADTGNHRILILDADGRLLEKIGGNGAGFRDGDFERSLFNGPQGLVFQNDTALYVADTENHAIRKICLREKLVETVAGTGKQGGDFKGGKFGKNQEISSPWDVCVYRTADIGNPSNEFLKDVIIIAMAGTHQIWALFLNDTVWWKGQRFAAGTCVSIAGSGREQNKNNQYPHAAAFAQPSGLAVFGKDLFLADSESSTVRRLSLEDGTTTAVVGGDRNPVNLFAFGDKDGKLYEAKLQHPLGLGFLPKTKTLFVADTYNHKLKMIDTSSNTVSTVVFEGKPLELNEPGGLCASFNGAKLYVADTNNHAIKVISLDGNSVKNVQPLELKDDGVALNRIEKSAYALVECKPLTISPEGGKILYKLRVKFHQLSLTADAPQKWFCDLPNLTWLCVPYGGNFLDNLDVVVNIPSASQRDALDFVFNLMVCCGDVCLPKKFIVRQPVQFESDAKCVSSDVQVILSENDVKLL